MDYGEPMAKKENTFLKKDIKEIIKIKFNPLILWVFLVGVFVGLAIGDVFEQQLPFSPDKNISKNPDEQSTDISKSAEAYLKFKEIKASLIPSGVPNVYGSELNISFDKAQEAINKVAIFDPTYGAEKITLAGDDLKRYIDIGSLIACKYCCGAKTLVFPDGQAACGCEHSQMMRGLAAYLIKNYPELSNDQILKELFDWRAVFFPKQTLQDKLNEMKKSGESGIEELLQEFPEFLPEMVGGC